MEHNFTEVTIVGIPEDSGMRKEMCMMEGPVLRKKRAFF
jgi:hypothetical protein